MPNPFNPFIPLLMFIRRILGKDKPNNYVATPVKEEAPVEIQIKEETPVQIQVQEEIRFEVKEEAPVEIQIKEEIKLEIKETPMEVPAKPSKKEKPVVKKPQAKSSVVSKSGRNPKFKK